jgi:hypothetical protein
VCVGVQGGALVWARRMRAAAACKPWQARGPRRQGPGAAASALAPRKRAPWPPARTSMSHSVATARTALLTTPRCTSSASPAACGSAAASAACASRRARVPPGPSAGSSLSTRAGSYRRASAGRMAAREAAPQSLDTAAARATSLAAVCFQRGREGFGARLRADGGAPAGGGSGARAGSVVSNGATTRAHARQWRSERVFHGCACGLVTPRLLACRGARGRGAPAGLPHQLAMSRGRCRAAAFRGARVQRPRPPTRCRRRAGPRAHLGCIIPNTFSSSSLSSGKPPPPGAPRPRGERRSMSTARVGTVGAGLGWAPESPLMLLRSLPVREDGGVARQSRESDSVLRGGLVWVLKAAYAFPKQLCDCCEWLKRRGGACNAGCEQTGGETFKPSATRSNKRSVWPPPDTRSKVML